MKIAIDIIRKVREETGSPVIRAKKVLEEVGGDRKKAIEILRKEGFEKASKRQSRKTGQGKIFVYMHHTGKIVSVVELFSETDFVVRNELFEELGKNIAMQVASMGGKSWDEVKVQEFIKDPAKKVEELVKEIIAKTGENIRVGRIYRVELGNG